MQSRFDDADGADRAGAWSLDGVNLSFEMALQAGAGVVIAKASASATFSIDITWKCSE